MAKVCVTVAAFDAVVALYSIIHAPLAEQPRLFAAIAAWLKLGGWFMRVLGQRLRSGRRCR